MNLRLIAIALAPWLAIACSSGGDAPTHGESAGTAGVPSGAGADGSLAGGAGVAGALAGSGGGGVSGMAGGGAFGSGGAPSAGGGPGSGGSSAGGQAGGGGDRSSGGDGGRAGSGGGAGTGGTGGTGGASAYHPCPTNGSPCKILPFGDSITHGFRSSDDAGYRSQLFKLIVAANQKADFVGSLTNGPTQVSGQSFPRTHEGHSGWTIDPGYSSNSGYSGISSLIPSPALNGNPNIVLLHIGTNDLFARDTTHMSTRLEALIDKVAQNAPSALIVLAQITPLGTANAALTAYNSAIPGIVQAHAAKGQHIIGVDMSKLPVPADLNSDGTHPNDKGYAYMANIWYAAINDLLPR